MKALIEVCAGNYENQVTTLNNQVIYFVNDVLKFNDNCDQCDVLEVKHNCDQCGDVSLVVECKVLVNCHGC